MRNLVGYGVYFVAFVLGGILEWRIVVTGLADRLVREAPEQALVFDSHNPTAMLALANKQLDDESPEAAASIARELLRAEPVTGDAFVVLAKSAEKAGDKARAEKLYAIAVRRAPRSLHTRAWIIEDLLGKQLYADALAQFDTLFRLDPTEAWKFLPLFAQLADTREFSRALIAALSKNAYWKAAILSALLDRGGYDAINNVFGGLQLQGNLSEEETGLWLDRLMRDGLWGQAYSRWVSGLVLVPGAPLPLLYNGRFEKEPTGIGFDWRIRQTAGATIEREPTVGATGGFVMHIRFSLRRVPEINLEQRLLLAPGKYRFSFRARAESLRSDKGLQWAIQCYGQNELLAASDLLGDSFAWKRFETRFSVPDANCTSQRIWVRNPGAAAAGKEVAGDIWFDDLAINMDQNLL